MTKETKRRMYTAAMNAAEMIRGHVEVGLDAEDVGELDDDGVFEYGRSCERIANQIETLANKYK